jgi:hypothetical protein
MADVLQRYKCRACGKTFNALSGTPLARLRHKDKWLEQTQALAGCILPDDRPDQAEQSLPNRPGSGSITA